MINRGFEFIKSLFLIGLGLMIFLFGFYLFKK
jgi:hypothetical protein